MWEKLRVVFTIPELRRKIFLTLMLLAVYRIGWQVPLPIFDQAQLQKFMSNSSAGGLLKTVATFSASALQNGTIFGLGIMPYISASIILQLLGTFWKPIEQLQKEGDAGRKKINQYTRLLTVVLCVIQSWIYISQVSGAPGSINSQFGFPIVTPSGEPALQLYFSWHVISVLIMTAGSVFLMWLGEQIDEYGIGNGISLLIMANILSNLPGAVIGASDQFTMELGGDNSTGKYGIEVVIMMVAFFVLVVLGVVLMTLGQRRIPTLSAKHVRGNRVYGGTKDYLPLKVNQSGVMPIIFASSLLLFPAMIFSYLAKLFPNPVMGLLNDIFSPQGGTGLVYNLVLVAMIFFFCYFWTAISFNPKEISENLKNMGAFIPGHRPGTPTAHYLEKVMVRITFVGAFFLSIVAILPTLVNANLPIGSGNANLSAFYGGTSLLIAVSVAFDLVQKIDSYLVMRNYKGLLQ